ncbi:MAG TPA: hypothetical protein VIM93_05850 [Kangiella sp.]
MLIIKSLLILFLASSSGGSMPVNDEMKRFYPGYDEIIIMSFNDIVESGFSYTKKMSYFAVADHDDASREINFRLEIGHSRTNKQGIYIIDSRVCIKENRDYREVIIKIGNQNIRFLQNCRENLTEFTPATSRGEEFFVEHLKSNKLTGFFIYDFFVIFKTDGFEEAWESFGGDAI